MFIPNQSGLYTRRLGTNAYAEPIWSRPVRVACAVVRLQEDQAKTSVRADTSASRSSAEETTQAARILLPASVRPATGDRLEVGGRTMMLTRIHPRYSVMGGLDHYEVDGVNWDMDE